ncbi:hypothetical protein, partial [Haloechinothrix alba]|uniref:hypothetical protein n=1 Tax=Haloechinothrix alba TaxID=664784 RepID=UPI001C3DFBCD
TPPGHSTTPFSAQISPATETNQQVNRSHSSRPAERGKSQDSTETGRAHAEELLNAAEADKEHR